MNFWEFLTHEYIIGQEYGFRWIYPIIAIGLSFIILIILKFIVSNQKDNGDVK